MPNTATPPWVAGTASATTLSKVDLPHPDGPSRLRKPPRSSVKETFSSAVTVRRSDTKRTVTLRQETAAGSGTPSAAADAETPA